jgi:hypothetical protein
VSWLRSQEGMRAAFQNWCAPCACFKRPDEWGLTSRRLRSGCCSEFPAEVEHWSCVFPRSNFPSPGTS